MMGMKKRMKKGGASLKGGQSKLDKNKDGKIDAKDFAMMKKKKKKRVKAMGGGSMKKRVKAMGGGSMKKRMKRGGKV